MAAGFDSHFELIIPKKDDKAQVKLGSEITIPCHLSAGAQFRVDTDIKWFKETKLVCHYKNRRVTEGVDYENRLRLLTEEINKGQFSLTLKEFKESDFGDYFCQVTCGNIKKEITIKVEDLSKKIKERNIVIRNTVGAIGLAALPVTGAAFAFGGAVYAMAAIATAATAAAAAAAGGVTILIFSILFTLIKRKYDEQERREMEISLQRADEKKISEQERQEMEISLQLAERRNSIGQNPPTMSE